MSFTSWSAISDRGIDGGATGGRGIDVESENARPGPDVPILTWLNVLRGFLFILSSAALAHGLQIKFTTRLFIAAFRCVAQLTLLSYILKPVLASLSPWPVIGLTFVFLFCGVFETVLNNAVYTFRHMGAVVSVAMIASLSLHLALGMGFAIQPNPYFAPQVLIPIAGMLTGQMISGVSLALKTLLTAVVDHPERIETMLAFGARRIEVYRPALSNALRTGLLPLLNSMSVMGLISIPGQMTGQILAGADVAQAAHYQVIVMMIMFSCSMMGQLLSVLGCLFIIIDKHLVVRDDLITSTNFVKRIKGFFASGVWLRWIRGYRAVETAP